MIRVIGNGVFLAPFRLPGKNATAVDGFATSIHGMSVEGGKLSSFYMPRVRGVRLVGVRVGVRNLVWSTGDAIGLDLSSRAVHWRFEARSAPSLHPSIGITFEFRSESPARISRAAFWFVPTPRDDPQRW